MMCRNDNVLLHVLLIVSIDSATDDITKPKCGHINEQFNMNITTYSNVAITE